MVYIALSIVSSLLFYFTLHRKVVDYYHIQQNWLWNKSNLNATANDKRFKLLPLDVLNGYKTEAELFMFKTKKAISIPPKFLIEYPLNGNGFLVYKKIDKYVSYRSGDGEMLWEKPFKSYPRISYSGNLILFISGDNNQVILTDKNGIEIGVEKLNGRFLTDYSFPLASNGALVVFSGGEIFRINDQGNIIYQKQNDSQNELHFYKSSAISPSGNFSVIHLVKKDKDFIEVSDATGKIIYTFPLENVYPHKIFMALSDSGECILNLPEVIYFLSKTGNLQKVFKKAEKEGIYQIAFNTGRFFIVSSGKDIIFIDSKGEIINSKTIFSSPNRIIPSGDPNSFFLETPNNIMHFQMFLGLGSIVQ